MTRKQSIDLNGKTILVTGSPGFIGANLVIRLLRCMSSGTVISFDNMDPYYDPALKEYRLRLIEEQAASSSHAQHFFIRGSVADQALVERIFIEYHPDIVVHLAAQAGVRYSIDHPDAYIESNIIGFYNILEACRHSYGRILADFRESKEPEELKESEESKESEELKEPEKLKESAELKKIKEPADHDLESEKTENCLGLQHFRSVDETDYQGVQHLIFATSSSVYGNSAKIPFSTDDKADEPVSLYAATKKSDELMAHAYAKLYNIPCTGLRFFTVYGPAGRPDMFYYIAAEKLLRDESIKLFNYGDCLRDFTYIDDTVEGIVRVMQGAPEKKIGADGLPVPPYALYNIGKGRPENLMGFIQVLQEELVRSDLLPSDYDLAAHQEPVAMQPGDISVTYADTTALERDYGYKPETDIRTGLRAFVDWYRNYKG